MSSEEQKAKLQASFEHPFVPASSGASGASVDPALRIASALEYIAFQLGQMNMKMDALTAMSKTEKPA